MFKLHFAWSEKNIKNTQKIKPSRVYVLIVLIVFEIPATITWWCHWFSDCWTVIYLIILVLFRKFLLLQMSLIRKGFILKKYDIDDVLLKIAELI